jgi:hypothetical protein
VKVHDDICPGLSESLGDVWLVLVALFGRFHVWLHAEITIAVNRIVDAPASLFGELPDTRAL